MSHDRDLAPPLPLDRVTADYAAAVLDRLQAALGDSLVGVYLHGSAVLGDFDPARSDVDVLAVCSGSLTDGQADAIAARLSAAALPCPARGLELHVVALESRRLSRPPPFELHLATSGPDPERVVRARGGPGDPDLVMHFAVLHDHGRALIGPRPEELFPRPSRDELLAAFAGELRWAEEHVSPSYQVLNACRAWRFHEEDVLCSKAAGGDWARTRVHEPAAIELALRNRRGADEAQPDPEATSALVRDVLRRLELHRLSSRT